MKPSCKRAVKRQKNKFIPTSLLVLVFILLPVLIRLRTVVPEGQNLLFFSAPLGKIYDLTLYYKSGLLVTAALCLLLFFLGERIFPDRKVLSPLISNPIYRAFYLAAGVFSVFSLLSLLLSENRQTAFFGAPNSFEGTAVLLCYLIVFLMAANYFDDEYNIAAVMKLLPFLFAFFILYGLVEFFFRNPYELGILRYLVIPPELWSAAGNFSYSTYRGQIFLTFANPDYAGEYLALFLPLSFMLAKNSKGAKKAGLYGICVGLVLLLCMTGAVAALFAFVLSFAVLAVLYRRTLTASLKSIGGLAAAFCVILTVFTAVKGNPFSQGAQSRDAKPLFRVDEIRLDGDRVYFSAKDAVFCIRAQNDSLAFLDADNHSLPSTKIGEAYHFSGAYTPISVTVRGSDFLVDLGYQSPVAFTAEGGKILAVGTNGARISDTSDSSGFGFSNLQSFATGRGYILRKSLPLLSQTLLTGFGADCAVYHIPQNDFAGKLNYQGSAALLIDKPHSLYLQTALNCGLPALLALLAILVLYARAALKGLHRQPPGRYFDYSAAIFAGICAFALCALVYDSSVSVTPLFFAMTGLGLALSQKTANVKKPVNCKRQLQNKVR